MTTPTPLALLTAIPDLAAEVEATRDHPNPGGRTDRVMRPALGSRPPTDIAALHACMPGEVNGLRAELVTSVSLIVEEMSDELPTAEIPDWPSDTWAGLCGWLAGTASWWTRQPWASDVLSGIRQVHAELQHLARTPRPLRVDCTTPGCHGSIYPEVHETSDGPKLYAEECENGHRVDRHEAVRRAYRVADYPLSDIADTIGVPVKTLHRWAKLGAIQSVRRSGNAALYNLEAVQMAAARLGRAG